MYVCLSSGGQYRGGRGKNLKKSSQDSFLPVDKNLQKKQLSVSQQLRGF
jgi:hypothetical protein